VRKESGCNHMVCRCGTDFCFGCGGPYDSNLGQPCVCSRGEKRTQLGYWLRFYGKLPLK
jgi:hypothetical protein